ncbi:MAG: hypothetical protein RIQ52_1462 [Pseudomonadota bacterium]
MNKLIEVHELYRYYDTHCAVNNVSFQLEKGQILGFLGPNGAGKSSTMQMICGNLAPTSGEIRITGIDMLEDPRGAKRALGYLPETPPLYSELTVDEYLDYCARLHQVPTGQRREAVTSARERTGLADTGSRLIGHLSKGYQQRVGIAQAIVHNPQVVILDEPTVGLDPVQIREIRELVRELGREHGVILSTHILPEVQEVCTHVQIINRGKMVLSTSIEGLAQNMDAGSMVFATQQPVDSAMIMSVEGIRQIENLSQCRYRIYFDRNRNPAPALAARVVDAGWGLIEMTPEKLNMEQIFIDLTKGDLS